VEAMPASRGGRRGGGVAVFLVAAIRIRRTRRAAGFVVEVKIGRAAVSAASPTTTPTPHVTLCLQQELPVYSFQIKIVHREHGASPLRQQSKSHYERRRYPNMWIRLTFATPFLWGLWNCRHHSNALGNIWKLL
jgi:hypothetical protein